LRKPKGFEFVNIKTWPKLNPTINNKTFSENLNNWSNWIQYIARMQAGLKTDYGSSLVNLIVLSTGF
jgi:hypothetical protein